MSESSAHRIVARFEIGYTQMLDETGQAVPDLPAFARDADALRSMYASLVRSRAFDQRAVVLQRTGQLGTYAASLGQEAIGTAMGMALQPQDVLIPAYREYAALFLRGVEMSSVLRYWGGDERGMDYAAEPARHDFPLCVPIGTQLPHAVGVAYAFHLRREPRVVLASCGDGATSKGDFHEAVSACGIWKLPLVIVISNNQWAISLPRSRQCAAQTLAQKAMAGGIRGEQVDGNDVIATRAVIEAALDRARAGEGPTLI
ncbi:MAG TPA: thiamine pyrophosphate-dependent enzyme, partial [Solimonas sp.]|nr:thiamine pyrophosphate-dependent enzyme [Solimonas sp.]